MFKYIFLVFFIYIMYQVVFKLVLPLFRATSMMKQRVSQMNDARQQYENQVNQNQNAYNNSPKPQPEKKKEKEGEYIDFEEIS